jgi:hypothetical protein
LARLGRLKRLTIKFTPVRDRTPLKGLHRMEQLTVCGTKVSLSAIIAFKRSMPGGRWPCPPF